MASIHASRATAFPHSLVSPQTGFYSPLDGQDDDPRMNRDNESIYSQSSCVPSMKPLLDRASSTPAFGQSPQASQISLAESTSSVDKPPTLSISAARMGFKTEKEYLDALRSWAEEQKFAFIGDASNTVSGFYGPRTLEEYAAPGREIKLGRRRRQSASTPTKTAGRPAVDTIHETPEESRSAEGEDIDAPLAMKSRPQTHGTRGYADISETTSKTRRKSSFSNFLRRTKTSG